MNSTISRRKTKRITIQVLHKEHPEYKATQIKKLAKVNEYTALKWIKREDYNDQKKSLF